MMKILRKRDAKSYAESEKEREQQCTKQRSCVLSRERDLINKYTKGRRKDNN